MGNERPSGSQLQEEDRVRANLRVSVVVVSRRAAVGATLQSLVAQSCPPFEILVVDTTGLKQPGDLIRRFVQSNPESAIRLVEAAAQDADVPENAAIAAATGEVVALTDDSSIPHPDWIASIAAALTDSDSDASTGPVGHGTPRNLVERYFTMGVAGVTGVHRTYREFTLGSDPAPVANFAVRKAAFDEIGGFDPAMPVETRGADLCARLCATGCSVVYHPAMSVSLPLPNTVHALLARSLRIGKGHARLLRRHFDQKVQLDVAGRHWSTDSVSLRVWVALDDPDKTLAASFLGLLITPWLAVLPVAYLGYLAWSVRVRSSERGLNLAWPEVLGMTGLAILESAARTMGRIRGSFDDAVVCI